MELYLIRHAIAEDGDDDDARALTPKGAERFREVVAGLDQLGVRVSRVLHSPKLRAMQTAELLHELSSGPLEVTELLAGPPTAKLLAELTGESVAVVGHQPHLGELVSLLLSGDRRLAAAVELKKGAVVRLSGDCAPGAMRLTLLLQPKEARRCRP